MKNEQKAGKIAVTNEQKDNINDMPLQMRYERVIRKPDKLQYINTYPCLYRYYGQAHNMFKLILYLSFILLAEGGCYRNIISIGHALTSAP